MKRERRKSPRIIVESVTVEVYKKEGEPEAPEICDVINISETGMMFISRKTYDINQLLRVTFVLPDSMLIIRTNATTVHFQKKTLKNVIGVQFAKLGPPERYALHAFVEHFTELEK
jgi:c-di-GMP-binding flagellar brake protein YcgR